jgi:signal transduction histidine kinase
MLFLLAACHLTSGQAILHTDSRDEQPLRKYIYQYEDTKGTLDIIQAIKLLKNGSFKKSKSATVRQDFGYNESSQYWLFFELQSAEKRELMLEIEYANIDHLELFELRDDHIRSMGFTGDIYNYSQRPHYNNNYTFLIRLAPGQKTGYFLHVNQPNAILSFAMRLWDYNYFKASDRNEYVLWGIFIGIIVILMVVNLVMLISIRDWIYFWYMIYLHCITMHLFSDAGLGYQYLWPDNPEINVFDPVYLYVWGGMIAQLTFMQYFIHQNRRNSRVFNWIIGFKILIGMALVAAIGIHALAPEGKELYMYKYVSTATSLFVLVMVLLTIVSLYEKRHEKEKLVRYYSYALTFQFLAYVVVTLLNISQSKGWQLPFDVETYVIMAFAVVFDIIFFSYGLVYRFENYRKNNINLELRILNTRQESQKRIIDSLEEERRRIAQDLHDDIGATLSTAKGYLSVLGRDKKSVHLQKSQGMLDKAAEELRAISHTLMPKNFNKIGLSKTISESIRKMDNEKMRIDFISLGNERRLDEESEMLIFRMFTELIRNIEKHSGATEVTIQLIYHEEFLNLIAEDNGRGFDHHSPEGRGLTNLYARADYLKGEILIDSSEHGTSVILTVPTQDLMNV